jgi:hypothetical protein
VPNLRRITRARLEARGELRQVCANGFEISPEEELGLTVVRRANDLRKVDDDGALMPEQDVVWREIAVNQVEAQHAHNLRSKKFVDRGRLLGVGFSLDESRRRMPLGVNHQLHQEHALVEQHRGRHENAVRMKLEKGVSLGALPGFLGRALTKLRPLVHRALGARVPNDATFFVAGIVLEISIVALLVDLRGDHVLAVPNQKDFGFLAGLQATEHRVDDAICEQGFEGVVVVHASSTVAGNTSGLWSPSSEKRS